MDDRRWNVAQGGAYISHTVARGSKDEQGTAADKSQAAKTLGLQHGAAHAESSKATPTVSSTFWKSPLA